MKDVFEKIWELASPYHDKRDDIGHARITLDYAIKLLEREGGDENVVIPAIILHYIGWSQIPKAEWSLIFISTTPKEQKIVLQTRHQKEGVRLAEEILNKLNYPQNLIKEILEIISQHDTREGFISKNEGLVRDADKLWRYSRIRLEYDLIVHDVSVEGRFENLETRMKLPNFFYSDSAREIAQKEIELLKKEFLG